MNEPTSGAGSLESRIDLHIVEGTALQAVSHGDADWSDDTLEREERSSLQRIQGLETGISREEGVDIEYRQVRLERVVLVGLWSKGSASQAEDSLRELAALAETVDSKVLNNLIQQHALPDPATYLGSEKTYELADFVAPLEADTMIVDSELAPSQRRGLEGIVKVKIIDRTVLIPDIFARHAKSRESKAQVGLAQLEYLLPCLRGWGDSMSRQAEGCVAARAGIGSRGPGETQFEFDRRRIRMRMAKLRRDIKRMGPARQQQRAERRRAVAPSAVVVGYTNAGKSSLLNRLTGARVLVGNALFTMLDLTVRRTQTASGREYTLADTAGLVRQLPTQFVEALHSTLEEAGEADMLVHVVDASHYDPVGQVKAVRKVLAKVPGTREVYETVVLSKSDLADPVDLATLRLRSPGLITVSCLTGEGVDELRAAIEEALPQPEIEIAVVVPYSAGALLSRVHDDGELLAPVEYRGEGISVHARVPADIEAAMRRGGMLSPAGTK